MRHRLFMIWAALRWVPLMFLIAPAMEAPLVAHLNQPVKPIKTWVGNASWYGPGFNGRKTANGESFDCEALTAAHPNLPFELHAAHCRRREHGAGNGIWKIGRAHV